MNEKLHDLLFGVRRSVRYHVRRRAWFDGWHTLTAALALVFSSATVMALFKNAESAALAAGALVTLLTALDLVIGFAAKARLHHDLARGFIELERDMVLAGATASVADFTARRLQLESGEPPVLRVLDVMCHNELVRAMGCPASEQKPIGFWQRLFAPAFDLQAHTLAN